MGHPQPPRRRAIQTHQDRRLPRVAQAFGAGLDFRWRDAQIAQEAFIPGGHSSPLHSSGHALTRHIVEISNFSQLTSLLSRRRNHGGAERMLACQDRKSTRLNSSHGYISYAVFCLKKKKKINIICLMPRVLWAACRELYAHLNSISVVLLCLHVWVPTADGQVLSEKSLKKRVHRIF